MGIRLEKNWEILNSARIKALPGQLGVYQIADKDEQIISVGYAGAKEPFGIRSASQGPEQFRVGREPLVALAVAQNVLEEGDDLFGHVHFDADRVAGAVAAEAALVEF